MLLYKRRAFRGALVAIVVGTLTSQRAAATTAGFWERVAAAPRAEAERLVSEAEVALAAPAPKGTPPALARAEALVRRALVLVPDDFRALSTLAEIDARLGREVVALADLERACRRAPAGPVAGACWFQLGVERSRRGRFAEALAAYEARLALGDGDAAGAFGGALASTLTNVGEVLMAMGRLREAEQRYREAIRLVAPTSTSIAGRLDDRHGLLLATYGLAVVLDREGEAIAAREMMARALALDPKLNKLEEAREGGGDVFFVPEGEVFYYLGLAYEVAERVDDAQAAFQEFAERVPKSAWVTRARAHLAALEVAGRPRAAPRLRVTAAGTVAADGPIPAPLVDAAWRQMPGMLDACLDEASRAGLVPPRSGFRFSLELELDARGAVSAVAVKAAAPLAQLGSGPFARCVDDAVRGGLRVPRPRTPKPTRARVEVLVGLAAGNPGGL
jgi:tetratricopeptide (TPR) repeat protein